MVLYFETSLLEDTVVRPARDVNAGMPGDTHQAELVGMLKVAMASSGSNWIPTILLNQLDDVAHFHRTQGRPNFKWLRRLCRLVRPPMKIISYSHTRAHLAATMDRVVADHAPVIITRKGSPSCVLVSLDDWKSMDETNYLRSSPINAQRLNESIRELQRGGPEIVHLFNW
jgi:antitoxin YefM